MDAAALKERILWTLESNADLRRQAELDLKRAEDQPGFVNALLEIVENSQEPSLRQSAVIFLKNRASRAWTTNEEFPQLKTIPEDEKANVRSRILPLLASSPSQIRMQLLPLLQKILNSDFPSQWPDFFGRTVQLLSANDANSVYAGLQCMVAICRVYRYKSGDVRAEFNQITENSFPRLQAITQSLQQETTQEAWEMLHIVMKAYKHAIYFDLPPFLMHQDRMVGWCTLFLGIIAKEPPPFALQGDDDEKERNHFWKSKKWAYSNLNRLFTRYGHPSTNQKNASADMVEFSKLFLSNFAPEILKGYLQQIEKWASKSTWLSKASLSCTLMYLDECIKPKAMWKLLKPHMDSLSSHVIFPLLCQTDEDVELFDSDPSEYLHRKLNFYEEITSPDVAATSFLVSLTKSRKEQTFSILNFVNEIVNKYEAAPEDQKNPREKEGALRMIGTLASVILGKKSPIADQVEYFFVRHVFPEFRSRHGYLRARACDTLGKFEQLNFKDSNNLLQVYNSILECMADPDLPVRVEAALAIQPLIRHEVVRDSMRRNIGQIMQQLLKLANEVDVDALANVMEDFVEEFSSELTPFAVALSEQLRDTYLRLVREVIERNNAKSPDEGLGDYLDDKSITALGVLQTIGTLILTLEATPDVLLHLETILIPVIQITLDNKLYDLFNEVFDIIDSCTFSVKMISPSMWQAFQHMHKAFKAGAELYLEDMLPALENFIAYGSQHLVQNRTYLEAIVEMITDIFNDPKVGGMDRLCGCKLAEALMLNIRDHIDFCIPTFIQLAMLNLNNPEPKVKSVKVHLMEMVVNAIYYNPLLALQVLESNGWTNKFLSIWFSSIESFTRVHDKKLAIVAISALLSIEASQIPSSVQSGWPRLVQGAVRLFQTLPAAMKNREEAKEAGLDQGADDFSDEDGEGGANEWNEEESWEDKAADDGEDVKDESAAYLEFLTEESQRLGGSNDDLNDDDDDLEEETLMETPLEKVEPYGYFKVTLLKLQSEQPNLYSSVTKVLNPTEQQVLQGVIVQADSNAQAAQAVAAARAAQEARLATGQQQLNGTAH